MKNMITQYSGLKREVYILFVGKLVTAMGSFVWPMLTFLLTAKLGFSDGTAAMLIATAGLISLPVTLCLYHGRERPSAGKGSTFRRRDAGFLTARKQKNEQQGIGRHRPSK